MPRRATLAAAGRRRFGPPTSWSAPITITSGGTYTGAWESLNPDVAAVTVSTTAPVTIQNSYIRSKGPCIRSGVNGTDLVVKNCRALGLNPGVAGRSPGRFVQVEQFTRIHILNNYFESTAGIHLLDFAGASGDVGTVSVLRNQAKNIDGRISTGAGFSTDPSDYDLVQFFQADKVVSGGIEVAWNECTNIHNQSRPEDVMNLFKSSGFSGKPARFHDNLINGAYPVNADTNTDFTGGGIIADGDDTAPGSAVKWMEIYDNTVLQSANYGVAVASGSNNSAHHNRVVSSGRIPSGASIANTNAVGTYVWNYHSVASWANNNSDNNTIGLWNAVGSTRNDTWFPDCMAGGCAANIALKPGQVITSSDVAAEVTTWRNRINAAGIAIGPTTPPLAAPFARPFFHAADWMWDPIPTSPVLDASSTAIAAALATGQHSCAVEDFAAKLVHADEVDGSTPRYDFTFLHANGVSPAHEDWGPDPFGANTVPLPNGTENLIPPGGFGFVDGHIAVADDTTDTVFAVWQATTQAGPPRTWGGSWGGITAFTGDGREIGGSSTGAGLSRYGCVIREAEIAAGEIRHALFFGTDIARPTTFRYPATKTDGSNGAGSATTIQEGTRVQLDPSINLAGISGITSIELMVGRALQTYGAYCGDNGGARMGFVFEYKPGSTIYSNAGLSDYLDLTHLPWSQLRVLRQWDGQ